MSYLPKHRNSSYFYNAASGILLCMYNVLLSRAVFYAALAGAAGGVLFFIPAYTFAQEFILVPCDGPDCNACHFILLGQNILNFFIIIAAFIAGLVAAAAGLTMASSGGDTGKLSKGKDMLKSAVVGIIILLAAWLIVDTVMKTLVDPEKLGRPWNQIECVEQMPDTETAPDELPPQLPAVPDTPATARLTQGEALSRLSAFGINLKDGASLAGVRPHVIEEVIELKQACDCDVLITEGTAGQHAQGTYSHANGYKLDLRTFDNPELVTYVRSLPSAGSWTDGTTPPPLSRCRKLRDVCD